MVYFLGGTTEIRVLRLLAKTLTVSASSSDSSIFILISIPLRCIKYVNYTYLIHLFKYFDPSFPIVL